MPDRLRLLMVLTFVTLVGCGPGQVAPTAPRGEAPSGGAAVPPAQAGPKTLVLAQDREIDGITRTLTCPVVHL